MTRAFASLVLASAAVVFLASSAQAADGDATLDGMYASTGVNPDGSQYKGFVHISHRGDSLVVSWMFPQAANGSMVLVPNSVGVGVVSDGMLAVSYYTSRAAGIVLYRIEEDGQRLAGHWTVAGSDGSVYTETLVKLPWQVVPGAGDAPDTAKPEPDPEPEHKPLRPKGSGEV
jgi:hypothetical protein